MDSMTRHFGLKKAVSGFLLVFNFHPCKEICGLIVLVLVLTVFVYEQFCFLLGKEVMFSVVLVYLFACKQHYSNKL